MSKQEVVYSLVSIYLDSPQLGIQYNQTRNFDFLGKGLGIVSPPYFVYEFSRKQFSYYSLLTDQISWPGCLYFLRYNMCLATICFPGYDVIYFEINFIFLIKPFLYMTKKSRQKLENENSFCGENREVVYSLVSIYLDSPQLGIQYNQTL